MKIRCPSIWSIFTATNNLGKRFDPPLLGDAQIYTVFLGWGLPQPNTTVSQQSLWIATIIVNVTERDSIQLTCVTESHLSVQKKFFSSKLNTNLSIWSQTKLQICIIKNTSLVWKWVIWCLRGRRMDEIVMQIGIRTGGWIEWKKMDERSDCIVSPAQPRAPCSWVGGGLKRWDAPF